MYFLIKEFLTVMSFKMTKYKYQIKHKFGDLYIFKSFDLYI